MTIAEPLPPGCAIARGYEVVMHLHRSRAMDVYDVWSAARRCRCIAKTLRPDKVGRLRATLRLATEGRLLRRLTHPHLVRGYGTVWTGTPPRPVVVIETLKGRTLAALVDEHGRLGSGDGALLGMHLGAALAYLHGRGYLHRDLKPSNIVVEAGRAKLLDLSLARPPGRGGVANRDGTREYMAPEQVRGDRLTAAVDAWGLGVVLYEALAGRLPFGDHPAEDSDDAGGEVFPQMAGPPLPLGSLVPVPAELGALVDRCLAADPRDRPSVDALTAGLAEAAGVDPRTAGVQAGEASGSRR
jgi:serine/threonine protein kinase